MLLEDLFGFAGVAVCWFLCAREVAVGWGVAGRDLPRSRLLQQLLFELFLEVQEPVLFGGRRRHARSLGLTVGRVFWCLSRLGGGLLVSL